MARFAYIHLIVYVQDLGNTRESVPLRRWRAKDKVFWRTQLRVWGAVAENRVRQISHINGKTKWANDYAALSGVGGPISSDAMRSEKRGEIACWVKNSPHGRRRKECEGKKKGTAEANNGNWRSCTGLRQERLRAKNGPLFPPDILFTSKFIQITCRDAAKRANAFMGVAPRPF